MPATKITPTKRYSLYSRRSWVFIPTVAAPATGPTRTEIDAGTDVSSEIISVTGFTVQGSTMDTPDAGNRVTGKVPGRTTIPDSSIDFYLDKTGNEDVRTLFTDDLDGYIAIFNEGDVAANLYDLWPITVLPSAPAQDVDQPGHMVVMFACDMPVRNLVTPAHAA